MIRKIISKAGETIAEVLIAMMIVVASMTILAGAIRSAAKANEAAQNELNVGSTTKAAEDGGIEDESSKISFVFAETGKATKEIDVVMHIAKNNNGTIDYCYYTKNTKK